MKIYFDYVLYINIKTMPLSCYIACDRGFQSFSPKKFFFFFFQMNGDRQMRIVNLNMFIKLKKKISRSDPVNAYCTNFKNHK